MINVGIIGCGFVGGALKNWLEHNNPECKLFISDPPKGYYDDLSNVDIAFLQIHVPTEDDGTQNLTSIHRPRAKRTKKHSERNTQSRNMPIQMESRRPWKPSTIT